MIKRLYILVFFAAWFVCAHAETIVLRTGARVKGTILFQNEEVLVVRDESGSRFQYPRSDVQEIIEDKSVIAEKPKTEEKAEQEEIQTVKKVSALLEIGGGASVLPNEAAGGAVNVDLLVGTHHIGARHLFIGGGLGYHGLFLGGTSYNFLPVQVALRMPFTEQKHAPVFGAALGYGIALSKNYLGGIYAGLDFGYRCRLNPKTAVSLVAFVQFQQAKVQAVETIEGVEFAHRIGRNFVTPGIKLALYF